MGGWKAALCLLVWAETANYHEVPGILSIVAWSSLLHCCSAQACAIACAIALPVPRDSPKKSLRLERESGILSSTVDRVGCAGSYYHCKKKQYRYYLRRISSNIDTTD